MTVVHFCRLAVGGSVQLYRLKKYSVIFVAGGETSMPGGPAQTCPEAKYKKKEASEGAEYFETDAASSTVRAFRIQSTFLCNTVSDDKGCITGT